MSSELAGFERAFIRAKKRIEYEYAAPYLNPVANPGQQSETDLRDRVRTAIEEDLPERDRWDMWAEKREVYRQLRLEFL